MDHLVGRENGPRKFGKMLPVDATCPSAAVQNMITKTDIIQLLRDNYPYLAAEYHVQRIGLFGSLAKDTFDAASDVDIIVEFQKPIGFKFVEFVEYLEQLLEREVDVLTPAGLLGIRVNAIADKITDEIVYV